MNGDLRRWAGLEVRHLLALQAIAEHGSFGKAAVHLGYSQSAISQQVAALERIVGEEVVERPGGSRPVRVTPAGKVVLDRGAAVFSELAAAREELVAMRDGTGGGLRVGAFQSVGTCILPGLLARLRRDGSPLRLQLTQTTNDEELLELLGEGELDVTFAMLPLPSGPYALQHVFSDPFVLLVSAEFASARGDAPVSLAELASLPLITSQRCRSLGGIEAQLRERGLEPNIVHRSDDNGTVRGLAAVGAGVALLPYLSAGGSDAAVRVLALDEPLPPRRVALCWREDRHAARARQAFLREVALTCRELGLDGLQAGSARRQGVRRRSAVAVGRPVSAYGASPSSS